MIECGLDTSLLLFAPTSSAAEIIGRLESLQKLYVIEKLFRKQVAFPSKHAVKALIDAGAFPYREAFVGVLRSADPGGVFSANDLARLLLSLIEREAVDMKLMANDGMASNVTITPTCPSCQGLPQSVQEERERLLLLLAIDHLWGRGEIAIYSGDHTQIRITCDLEILSPEIAQAGSLPIPIEASIEDLAGVSDISSLWNGMSLWTPTSSDDELENAIRLKCIQINGTFEALPVFYLGPSFSASLRACQANPGNTYGGVVLTKTAHVIANPETQTISPFKTSLGDAVHRSRDGAQAMRAHITKDGVALRLMYWALPNGTIELANVGPKHELLIHE